MRSYPALFIPALVLILASLQAGAQSVHPTTANISWDEFISRHNLHFDALPLQWNEGAFTGNGMLGMMVYVSEKDSALVFDTGRSDVTDHRKAPGKKTSQSVPDATVVYDFCRLPVGRLLLKTGKIISGKFIQDLWNAEIRGQLETADATYTIRAFTPRTLDVQIIEVGQKKKRADAKDYNWKFVPGNAHSPRALVRPGDNASKEYTPNPKPEISSQKNLNICKQSLIAGGDYATVWTDERNGTNSTLYITTANEVPEAGASVPVAVQTIALAKKQGTNDLEAAHRSWWHQFYQKSFLSIPDARTEDFYWIQIYKMATASRPGGPAVDLFGPYYKTSPWPGMWWNLNIQLTYYPVYESNHLELGENLIDIVDDNFEALTVQQGGKRLGNLAWVLHNYWKQFAYADDQKAIEQKWLPKAIKVYELYREFMQTNSDGTIGLTALQSPEYNGSDVFVNTNYNLALLRWLLTTMNATATNGNMNQSNALEWQKTLSRIIPYPTDTNGLMIGSEQALEKSHRHYSHLLALYPLFLLTPDHKEDSALVSKSVNHWHTLENGRELAGYSFTGAASLFAALGRGDNALLNLKQLLENGKAYSQFQTNTFYSEGGGKNEVIETPLSGAASVLEMLMQSRSGKIIIFPALPAAWPVAYFDQLRAEGGYLVSAGYEASHIQWIRIKSETGKPFILKGKGLSQLGDVQGTGKFTIKKLNDNEVGITLPAGTSLTLKLNKQVLAEVKAAAQDPKTQHSFGVKPGQQLKKIQDYPVNDFHEDM